MTGEDGINATENRRLVVQLAVFAVAMFGFGWLLVPLYDAFCEITGFGGRTGERAAAVTVEPDTSRTVTVQFVAITGDGEWVFRPSMTSMEVHPGQLYETTYFAQNLRSGDTTGHAVPSVSPGMAARHFQKAECFCFERQEFTAGEKKDMPVVFIIDPELPPEVGTVTLAYTFFESRG